MARIGNSQLEAVSTEKRKIIVPWHMTLNFNIAVLCALDHYVLQSISFLHNLADGVSEEWHKLSKVRVDDDCLCNWAITCSTKFIDEVTEVIQIYLFLVDSFVSDCKLNLT